MKSKSEYTVIKCNNGMLMIMYSVARNQIHARHQRWLQKSTALTKLREWHYFGGFAEAASLNNADIAPGVLDIAPTPAVASLSVM